MQENRSGIEIRFFKKEVGQLVGQNIALSGIATG
jgi:hypothetical protein